MKQLIEAYFTILLHQFQYDVSVYSEEKWMYYLICIPAFIYTVFFVLKWAVLTAPIWMPIHMIIKGFPVNLQWNKTKKKKKEKDDKSKTDSVK